MFGIVKGFIFMRAKMREGGEVRNREYCSYFMYPPIVIQCEKFCVLAKVFFVLFILSCLFCAV